MQEALTTESRKHGRMPEWVEKKLKTPWLSGSVVSLLSYLQPLSALITSTASAKRKAV
jgi:hypothetical protein